MPLGQEWNPERALASLKDETILMHEGDTLKAATALFKENAANAAQSIIHTALYSDNERVRLDASKYVVERVLGRAGDTTSDPSLDPLQALINEAIEITSGRAQGGGADS